MIANLFIGCMVMSLSFVSLITYKLYIMKNTQIGLAILCLLIFGVFSSCEQESIEPANNDNQNLSLNDLPTLAQDYLNTNHTDVAICEIDQEEDGDEEYTYEVTLVGGLELYFDANGNFLFSEQDDDGEC